MHGTGNDFVLVDTIRDGSFLGPEGPAAKRLCDRTFGIGADGFILVERSEDQLSMRMFNPDGSESEMCGNGLRTFARLCHDRGYGNQTFLVKTGAGSLAVACLPDGSVITNLGQAVLDPSKIGMIGVNEESFVNVEIGKGRSGTAVSMGNPHLVIIVDNVEAIDLDVEGPQFETHPFFPKRTNVHFVQVVSQGELIQRTWERGAGVTLACGTGACASVVATFLNGKTDRKVKVRLPGGVLFVEYLENGSVELTGKAEYCFEGVSSSLLES